MITAERLKELIKQGELIYFVNSIDNEVYSMQLNSYLTINSCWLVNEGGYWYKLDLLFETKERAEWHLKMSAERTERFEPPMWEDIEDGYFFVFFQITKDVIWEWQFEVIKGDCSNEGITFYDNAGYVKFQKRATKENYIKACEIVRDLFNRGSK